MSNTICARSTSSTKTKTKYASNACMVTSYSTIGATNVLTTARNALRLGATVAILDRTSETVNASLALKDAKIV
jgi:predicted dinucleotide-binding enzyme